MSNDMNDNRPSPTDTPRMAQWLGMGGWIPFWFPVALSVQAWLSDRSAAAEEALFTIYAALILSFLGGVRWGQAVALPGPRLNRTLFLSVGGCLIGLLAAFIHWLGYPMMAWALLALALLGHARWDRDAVKRGDLPDWFGRLRTTLTLGAIVSALAMMLVYNLARS
ncbi:DUF3429 domain-containing protein [Maricaulis sp. D1M11]|uniref:DUF3429 domain-containing protein n=1 Tax=Maricaulis sp. D1M11 TaxID=3076117 RepID=UPI0039B3F4A2